MYKKSEKMKLIRQSLEAGNCLGVAIKQAGMKSYNTIQEWRAERPMIDRYFAACTNRMENKRVDAVVDALFKTALGGSVAACAFYLKNKAGWKDVDAPVVNVYTQIWNGLVSKSKRVDEKGRILPVNDGNG